jgi:FKBP-type peptidyl-prolyl cis-trans isomerase (trigger factor)
MNITTKKLSASRTQATVIFEDDVFKKAESEVVGVLSKSVDVKGFRKGNAPSDMVREKISDDKILEETVQHLVPDALGEVMKKEDLKPIIRPRVEVTSTKPLTLNLVFVENPDVKVDEKGIKKDVKKFEKEKEKDKEKNKDKKDGEDKKDDQEKDDKMWTEEKFFEALASNTKVEIAEELLEEEVRAMLESHMQYLEQFGLDLEQYLKQTGKELPDFVKSLKPKAENRLKVRFGVMALVEKFEIKEDDPAKLIGMLKERILG